MAAYLTKLDAINKALISIGNAPINSLTNMPMPAQISETILNQTSQEVQQRGWNFNTEDNVTLSPDVDGYIEIADDVLRADPSSKTTDYTLRGRKLYNKSDHTTVFTTDVEVDLILEIDFDDLPFVAQNYIAIRAARVFAASGVGSATIHAFTEEAEQSAWLDFEEAESLDADVNLLNTDGSITTIYNRS